MNPLFLLLLTVGVTLFIVVSLVLTTSSLSERTEQ